MAGGTSRIKKKVEYTKQHLVSLWEDMEKSYISDGIKALREIRKQRASATANLNDC